MSMLMSLTQQNYVNTRQAYEFKVGQAFKFLDIFQAQQDKNEKSKQAQVSAFIAMAKGTGAYTKATAEDKAQWATHDLQAGYDVGFTESMLKLDSMHSNLDYLGTVGSAETGYSALMMDTVTGKLQTVNVIKGTGGGGKMLSISDVKSYNEQFPGANIMPGDSEVIANQKVAKFGSAPITTLPEGASVEDKNKATITSILKDNKVGEGIRTKISDALNVMSSVEDFAKFRQIEGFAGISPLNVLLDFKVPWVGWGLPFRESARSKAGKEKSGYIEAINLKVQQWASGAALTTAQTEQVNKFTPTTKDNDAGVRTKLNNLYNFMLTQVQGNLQSQGLTFTPERANLFEMYDMIQKASPEQLQQLKDAGLIK